MPNPTLDEILSALQETEQRQTFRKLDFYAPYPKQQAFHDAGSQYRERLLIAGNQLGKSYSGAAETAIHLTGEYPAEWLGHRFKKPVKVWAGGETGLVVRDVQQKLLCGEPGVESALGTGMIPKEALADKPTLARGVSDAFDTVQVKHLAPDGASVDGISILRFKSYEQGRTKFQGESIDFGWADEEPAEDVYTEFLTRTNATAGIMILTFTPLKGMSSVVRRFLVDKPGGTTFVTMTIDDAQHIPVEKRKAIIEAYPEYQRDARARGIPMLGSGLIYQVSMAQIGEPALEYIPEYWTKLWGIDFGIDHPFAAVLTVWDRDRDVLHVTHGFRMKGSTPLQQAAAIRMIGANVPVAWPGDGGNREKGSGEPLAMIYKRAPNSLVMLPERAQFPDGSVSVEAGILEMQQRMLTGRLRVANHLSEWWEEQRLYHRKDGLIVKSNDDLMDATRYAMMARRHGRAVQLGSRMDRSKGSTMAQGIDFDLS